MGSLTIVEIAEYHNDVVDSLKLYFSEISPNFDEHFFGRSPREIASELRSRIEETDRRSAFFLLTALEAAFRSDYLERCQKNTKGDVSDAFRRIYKKRKQQPRLDDDIFQTWREKLPAPVPQLISRLRDAFNFRHWLAHGRYNEPNLGRKKYDFSFVYSLADDVLNNFPLLKLH
jgi:hypothetical protein